MAAGARARARAERARLAAIAAEERARREGRLARRRALVAKATGWLPRRRGMEGRLAQRRRRNVRITVAVLVALNIVVWLVLPMWSARFGALVTSVLVAPVLYTMLFRR